MFFFSVIESVVSSSATVNAGEEFILTCTHSPLDNGLVVSWTLNGGDPITEGVSPDGATKSLLTVNAATAQHNGVYVCSVTFGDVGTLTGQVTQYVRAIEGTVTQYALAGAATHEITCDIYGDSLSAPTVWQFGETVLADDADYDISTSSDTYVRSDVLTINTLETSNTGTYQCSATYTDGSVATSKDISLTVYG